jgi:tetratricopeptide (TPR) repeat protein
MARSAGDYTRTHALLEESRSLFEAVGYLRGLAYVVYDLGWLAYDEGDIDTAQSLYTESLALFSELAERPAIASVLTSLGHTALPQGDAGRASAHYRESLALCRDLADSAGLAANFIGLANAEAMGGEALRAARWWGVAESLRETIGLTLLPVHRSDYADTVAVARGRCDGDAFNAAWQAGCALPLDKALAEALAGRC